jgi:hypothetical protein
MKAIEFKNRNFKIADLENVNSDIYFSIQIGSKQMNFCGEIEFNITVENGDHVIESVNVMLERYDWEHVDVNGFLNKRNTKLICEAIESIVMNDPESFGFDMEAYENDQMEWHADLNAQIKKEYARSNNY